MAKITISSDPGKGLTYHFQDEAVLGRQGDNTVPLADSQASRKHSHIFRQEGVYYIEDMGSRNGTYVNGKLTKKLRLEGGEEIHIGETTLLFQLAPDEACTCTQPPQTSKEMPDFTRPTVSIPATQLPEFLGGKAVQPKPQDMPMEIPGKPKKGRAVSFSLSHWQKRLILVSLSVFGLFVFFWGSRWLTLYLLE